MRYKICCDTCNEDILMCEDTVVVVSFARCLSEHSGHYLRLVPYEAVEICYEMHCRTCNTTLMPLKDLVAVAKFADEVHGGHDVYINTVRSAGH